MVKKAVNTKAKTSLQLFSGAKKINSWCLKGYKPLTKKNKNKVTWKY